MKKDKDGHDVVLGRVKLTYTGVKGLTLSVNLFVDYIEGYRKYDNKSHKVVENAHLIMFGTKYTLLNDKLMYYYQMLEMLRQIKLRLCW